jgi:hypothetical protein
MRINEIITPQEKVTQTPKSWAMSDLRQLRSAALNTKTSGYFSKGFETDDPFMYGKQAHMPSNLLYDGYYQYVQAIKPIMDSNPYVPRVYSIKLQRDQQGYVRPIYKMEKLVPGNSLNKKILYGIGVRLFGNEEWFKAYNSNEEFEELESYDLWKYTAEIISNGIQAYPGKPKMLSVSIQFDEQLLEVMKLIKMITIKNDNIELDLHSGNIMVRPGPIPQLVITDPLEVANTMPPTIMK